MEYEEKFMGTYRKLHRENLSFDLEAVTSRTEETFSYQPKGEGHMTEEELRERGN